MILRNLVASTLQHINKYNIVIRYQKKKSLFDNTGYNPDWVPKIKLYHKNRKPPLK